MIHVQQEDFDVSQELAKLTADNHAIGGVAVFVGLVRDMAGESAISAMTLEHYPAMTEKMLAEIAQEARTRWPLEASLVIHRYGRLEPGDRIVMVAAASAPRQAAFEARSFLLDRLKPQATLWHPEEPHEAAHGVAARPSTTTPDATQA